MAISLTTNKKFSRKNSFIPAALGLQNVGTGRRIVCQSWCHDVDDADNDDDDSFCYLPETLPWHLALLTGCLLFVAPVSLMFCATLFLILATKWTAYWRQIKLKLELQLTLAVVYLLGTLWSVCLYWVKAQLLKRRRMVCAFPPSSPCLKSSDFNQGFNQGLKSDKDISN